MEEELKFDFDSDEIEETIRELARLLEEQELEPQVLNVPRMLQMAQALKQLKAIADDDWKVTSVVHKPHTSMGVICIEAEDLVFDKPAALNNVLTNASNVDIFPLVSGKLRMCITFHGITSPVE